MEFHHPIMNTLWGHGGRTKIKKKIDDTYPWSKINVYQVLKYFTLDQVSKVWARYYTAQHDQTIMIDPKEEEDPPHDVPQDLTVDKFVQFSWQLKTL